MDSNGRTYNEGGERGRDERRGWVAWENGYTERSKRVIEESG